MTAFIGVVGITSALLIASFSLLAPEKASDWQVARNAVALASPAPDTAGDEATRRSFYPYSVVPGGVHSPHDLTDALNDPVVAAHYAAVNVSAVRVEAVRAPRRVHVSYRIGDKVYWTKRTVMLAPGERILTDGGTEIRSRCGNRIADAPQEPTSDDEPLITEFDRALVLFPDNNRPSADSDPVAPDASPGPPSYSSSGFDAVMPGDEAGSAWPAGSLTAAIMAPRGSIPGGSGIETPSSSGRSTVGGDTPDGDGPIVPTDQPPPSVPQPVPVSEPSSILLVATGLAGGAWRAWRWRRLTSTRPR